MRKTSSNRDAHKVQAKESIEALASDSDLLFDEATLGSVSKSLSNEKSKAKKHQVPNRSILKKKRPKVYFSI